MVEFGYIATKAQESLLRWLVAIEDKCLQDDLPAEKRDAGKFTGGDLIAYYAEQNAKNKHDKSRGGYANHGWRRAGGTALKRLADRGFMDGGEFSPTSIPIFRLNDKGREIGHRAA